MKKRIAILSALLLLTGCTGNVTSPVSQPSQSSQTSQTSQSEQSVTAPKESTPESSAQAEATAEPPSTEPVNTAEPPETMPTGELPGTGTAESLPVKAQYLEDVPELGEHDTFSQTDGTEVSESAVKVVFSAESTVSDFRLLSIAMQDIDDLHVLRRGAVLAARAYAGASAGSGSGVPGRYPEQWDLLHRRRWERKVLLRGYERHGRFPGTLGNNRNMKKSRSHTAAGS